MLTLYDASLSCVCLYVLLVVVVCCKWLTVAVLGRCMMWLSWCVGGYCCFCRRVCVVTIPMVGVVVVVLSMVCGS